MTTYFLREVYFLHPHGQHGNLKNTTVVSADSKGEDTLAVTKKALAAHQCQPGIACIKKRRAARIEKET